MSSDRIHFETFLSVSQNIYLQINKNCGRFFVMKIYIPNENMLFWACE